MALSFPFDQGAAGPAKESSVTAVNGRALGKVTGEGEMIEFLGLNHTGIVVTQLDRPIAFFQELFGFELLSRATRGDAPLARMTTIDKPGLEIAHLQGPGHRVELVCYAPAGGQEP